MIWKDGFQVIGPAFLVSVGLGPESLQPVALVHHCVTLTSLSRCRLPTWTQETGLQQSRVAPASATGSCGCLCWLI